MQKGSDRGFDWAGLPVIAALAQPPSSIGDAVQDSDSRPRG
jgi:hypothetical protein